MSVRVKACIVFVSIQYTLMTTIGLCILLVAVYFWMMSIVVYVVLHDFYL